MKKLVIIPVYNEAKTLKGVLDRIGEHHSGDIVAIDDGSTDGSARILDDYSGIKVISHQKNLGYGQSLIDGFQYAVTRKYDLAVTIDCDEQHEPHLIPMMFGGVCGHDVLSGSRYMDESEKADRAPEDRRRINMMMTKSINQATGFDLTDSFCGFKCYRTSALARLSLDEAGYAQPIQLWIQARHFGLRVKEIAVPRIYKNLDRKFGGGMDNPQLRLKYYRRVMDKEMEKWSMSLSSELTPTI
ncbi:hypothetical protein MNBD_NITROSPINAE04-695 [hydrothermal vent metagenome]|uniref:Glycosyltransferase 2-like domain-containing protein n=1 Tax=hydrothermal vent metagenome TaxID=652676 RepID=A0A3B1CDS7_9ZZZZ